MGRILKAIALYAGWQLLAAIGALVGTFLFAYIHDPHGDGTPGDGLLYLAVLVMLLLFGMICAYIHASTVWARLKAKDIGQSDVG